MVTGEKLTSDEILAMMRRRLLETTHNEMTLESYTRQAVIVMLEVSAELLAQKLK